MCNTPQPAATSQTFPRLDPSFGDKGRVLCDSEHFAGELSAESIYGITEGPDGAIRLASTHADQVLVVALTADGQPDIRFNGNGFRRDDLDSPMGAVGIDIQAQADGRLLLTAWMEDDERFVPGFVLLDAAGVRDPSFGDNGVTIVALDDLTPALRPRFMSAASRSAPTARMLASQRTLEQKWLIPFVVEDHYGEPSRTVLIRLNADGTLDRDFHQVGYCELTWQGRPCAFNGVISVCVDGRERLICAGQYHESGRDQALLAAFTANGELDQNFADNGYLIMEDDGQHRLLTAMTTPDQQVLAAGYNIGASQTSTGLLMRFTPEGEVDPGFNGGEPVTTPPDGRRTRLERALYSAEGAIVSAGQIIVGTQLSGVLARFHANGQADSAFGNQGVFEEATSGGFWAMQLDSQGRLLVAGGDRINGRSVGVVRRYLLSA